MYRKIWQIILTGRDFFYLLTYKILIKKGVPEKKSLPLKITCHIVIGFFILKGFFIFLLFFFLFPKIKAVQSTEKKSWLYQRKKKKKAK
jgi:hypothetical protein